MTLTYQNPPVTDAILDSEQVSTDSSGNPIQREYVVPQESIGGLDPYSKLGDLLIQVLDELKKIRILLEVDVVPGLSEDVSDESEDAQASEETTNEGIDEF